MALECGPFSKTNQNYTIPGPLLPLVACPLLFTSSMGRRLRRPSLLLPAHRARWFLEVPAQGPQLSTARALSNEPRL